MKDVTSGRRRTRRSCAHQIPFSLHRRARWRPCQAAGRRISPRHRKRTLVRAAGNSGRERGVADAGRWYTAIGSANNGITTSISIGVDRWRGPPRTSGVTPNGRAIQGRRTAAKRLSPNNQSHDRGYETCQRSYPPPCERHGQRRRRSASGSNGRSERRKDWQGKQGDRRWRREDDHGALRESAKAARLTCKWRPTAESQRVLRTQGRPMAQNTRTRYRRKLVLPRAPAKAEQYRRRLRQGRA